MHFDTSITYFVSGTLLLMVSLIATFKRQREDQQAKGFLAAYFWTYTLAVFIAIAVLEGAARNWPHIYRLGQIPALLIMPLSYLYVARKLYGKRLTPFDLLHLLPLAIYLVDYAPFFVLSGEQKLALMLAEAPYPVRLKLAYAEGWFMPDFGHTIIRYAVWLGYWVAEVVMLQRAMRMPAHPLRSLEPRHWQWLRLLVASQVLIFLPPLLAALLGSEDSFGRWINVAAMMASTLQCYYLIFKPEVLYSLDIPRAEPIQVSTELPEPQPWNEPFHQPLFPNGDMVEAELDDIEEASGQRYQLSEDALDRVEQSLSALMDGQQPFLKTRYSIHELALDSGVATHRISAYLNRRCGQNFVSYINTFRIQHCISRLENGDHQTKTLEALAQECGFQSRATFIRAFKSHTGQTPSDYLAGVQ